MEQLAEITTGDDRPPASTSTAIKWVKSDRTRTKVAEYHSLLVQVTERCLSVHENDKSLAKSNANEAELWSNKIRVENSRVLPED